MSILYNPQSYGQPVQYAQPSYGQQPTQFGYVQQSGAQNNVIMAVNLIGPALQHLLRMGQITGPESNDMASAMNTDMQGLLTAFRNSVIKTYGDLAVSQETLLQFAVNKLGHAINTLRNAANTQNTQVMNNYNLNNNNTGMIMNNNMNNSSTMNTPSTGIADMYGTGPELHNHQSVPATLPTQNNNPVQQPTAQIPTNQPYRFDVDENIVWFPPIFTEVPVPEQANQQCNSVDDPIFDDFFNVPSVMHAKSYQVQNNAEQVNVNVLAVSKPCSLNAAVKITEEAMNHNPATEKFVDVTTFDELCLLDIPYEEGKEIYESCRAAYKEGDYNKVVQILEKSGSGAAPFIQYILWLFNQATKVTFMRMSESGGKRLNPINTIAELSRLLTDSGDYADWKDDKDKFIRSLQLSVQSSMGRVFNKDFTGYLGIKNYKEQSIILTHDTCTLKFSDGSDSHTVYPNMLERLTAAKDEESVEKARLVNAKLQTEIDNKLKDVFPLLIKRKVAIHDLEIVSGGIVGDDFKARKLDPAQNTLLWIELVKREGILELVGTAEDTFNPLLLGMIYTDHAVVRRTIR